MPAFQRAIQLGADGVELDVRLTCSVVFKGFGSVWKNVLLAWPLQPCCEKLDDSGDIALIKVT
jgi:hypothetical protein